MDNEWWRQACNSVYDIRAVEYYLFVESFVVPGYEVTSTLFSPTWFTAAE